MPIFDIPGLPNRRTLIIAAALLTLSQLFSLATPYLAKLVIDEAIAPGRPDLLWIIAAVGIGLYALTAITRYWGKWLVDVCGEELWLNLRNRLFEKLQGLSLRHHRSRKIGELVSRVHSDSYHVKQLVNSVLPGLINLVVGVGGTGIILLILAPKLTLLALIPLPAALILGWIFKNRIRPMTTRKMELHGDLYSTLQEGLSGVEEIKIYNAEHMFAQRLDGQGRELKGVELKLARDRAKLFPILDFSISVVLLGALVMGGHMVIADSISIGTLVVFYYYIARSLGPIRSASGLIFGWYSASAAIERIGQLFECDDSLPRAKDPTAMPDPEAVTLAFEGVTFHYTDPHTDKTFCALDEVSFTLPPGARLAILGPSGSGKSTTGKLVPRLFDPQHGTVTMNGVPLPELAVDEVRKRVGYVGQEVFLFNATIEANILFGLPQPVTPAALAEVTELAQLTDLLAEKTDGLHAPVGEKGTRLSGGQKKRIALARALLRNPAILVIDQLASDLEEDLNHAIFQGLTRRPQLSILYLGHRIPAGFTPDAVYWMEHGRLEERTAAAT